MSAPKTERSCATAAIADAAFAAASCLPHVGSCEISHSNASDCPNPKSHFPCHLLKQASHRTDQKLELCTNASYAGPPHERWRIAYVRQKVFSESLAAFLRSIG
ncbi:hypothetical protein SADFL11_00035360 [Roseibium alexandrii DFL-11]|uniref:Uncharacterized protein n=1 Tax=Roseibium alexandrii (strain DSM 17067 / NCIMB 14079 / DFL-11) TaxID=244592 RepID=A0A5E8UWV6_ROSAD|nr:hypothetical protein SADFL11_00035360 [Roseibium alexandrii DFL-11]